MNLTLRIVSMHRSELLTDHLTLAPELGEEVSGG